MHGVPQAALEPRSPVASSVRSPCGRRLPKSLNAALSAFLPKPGAGHIGPAGTGEARQKRATHTPKCSEQHRDMRRFWHIHLGAGPSTRSRSVWIDELQRGFMSGREGVANIAEMDATARTLARHGEHQHIGQRRCFGRTLRTMIDDGAQGAGGLARPQMPVLWLFDFAAGFPSVSREASLARCCGG